MFIAYSRRGFIAAGIASLAALRFGRSPADAAAYCALTPEAEEGPFYIPAAAYRSDLASGHAGVPLAVEFRVVDAKTCRPIEYATIDIWHCDAMGIYSGYDALAGPPSGPPGGHFGPPSGGLGNHHGAPPNLGHGGPPHATVTNSARFLRGVATTGAGGTTSFSTIFPGFYEGRVNHIHLKVRLAEHRRLVHTGQLFFPEDLSRELSSRAPYAAHRIKRTTLEEDHVFARESGSSTIAKMRSDARAGLPGYAASLTLAVDRTRTPAPV